MSTQPARYWRGWEESRLAAFQQDQGSSNHCAKYAAAAALHLLSGIPISGDELVSFLDTLPLRGTFRYSIWGNHNGSLVFQTTNLVRRLARLHGLDIQASSKRAGIKQLLKYLDDGSGLSVISVTYFQGREPVIARGDQNASTLAASRWVGGHLMILGAYDPGHHNQAGLPTPWGFISSWSSRKQLYWMTDEDFRRCWGQLSPLNMVWIQAYNL